MNVPHDAEIKNDKRLQLRAAVKDEDLNEGSPDRLGGGLEVAENAAPEPQQPKSAPVIAAAPAPRVTPAALTSTSTLGAATRRAVATAAAARAPKSVPVAGRWSST